MGTNSVGVTAGGLVVMVRLMALEPERLPLSVTEAMILWEPAVSALEKAPPLPIGPSMLDVQAREAVRSPSSKSPALPAKLMSVLSSKVAPWLGELISTVGGWLPLTKCVSETISTGNAPAKPLLCRHSCQIVSPRLLAG